MPSPLLALFDSHKATPPRKGEGERRQRIACIKRRRILRIVRPFIQSFRWAS
ncbi:hypothetical protein GK2558 [Geobacillus kaustophilus HTA426]|uniref:Uncharacterized protein n=1 Tax=Geobacillus kaustophilus (strain HTA426) TaxID=235909 RepID=Q5KWU3_GEOKA|nr:hypothetical protein I656_01232 [Geobacillus sp. WSUCF1]BAD76843.1 hypothetical protein GK2558 [Geobacillus kaustophilus HTA426]